MMNKGKAAACEVVGNLQDVAYQRCSLILQELAVLHPSFLAKSVGMMETDYFEYVQAHQAQLPSGAANRLLQSPSPFVLIDSKVFLNGEDALLEFAATKTQLSKSEILAAAAFSASERSALDPTSAEYATQLEQAEMTLETRAEAAAQEALFQYRKTSGHQFAFFIFAVDGVTLPRVEVELFQDVCPSTCKNFAALCRGTVPDVGDDERMLGYKGISVHRVVKGGWIQTGDVAGEGRGDGPRRSIYGRDFPDESFAISHSAAGIVSMASDGPHSNGSQFFITLAPQPWLDRRKVAFGRVVSGLRAILAIGGLETQRERPCAPCVIADCGVFE